MISRLISKLNHPVFFFAVLLFLCSFYIYENKLATIGELSSDVWGYQFLEMQERFQYWEDVPPSYNQSELYIGFPLLYYLSPSLENGVVGYHILAVIIITLTFLITGLVGRDLFGSWFFAAILASLMIIPRFVFPTRIGLLDIGVVRGSILAMPFYILLSYWWIIKGLNRPKVNIILAAVAGLTVYLYPPSGVITVGSFILTALLVRGREMLKPIIVFIAVYSLVVSPFVLNHLFSPNTGMLDESKVLSTVEEKFQSEIIQYKFRGSGFLRTVDIADIKRSVWDETIILILFLASLYLLWRSRKDKDQLHWFYQFTAITAGVSLITISFSVVVEIANWWAVVQGKIPFFVDHLRPLRIVGVVLLAQSVALITIVSRKYRYGQVVAIVIVLLLIITPIRFFAPVIRTIVRSIIPESVRITYNLAPIVPPEDVRTFSNAAAAATFAREELEPAETKIFVFNDMQNDFRFKILSRHDTNLTNKEGNLWVTTGLDNSRRWYNERMLYKKYVDQAESFSGIEIFAQSLGMTHMLIPRGKYENLFQSSNLHNKTLYQNDDYRLIEL